MKTGLYIHVPFCRSRCIYCGFYSSTLLDWRSRYVEALCREMELRIAEARQPIGTVYLGGGTPSQLAPDDLQRLFRHLFKIYKVDRDAEITMECNPDDITPDFSDVLTQLPVNRISMGAQTFSDERLRFLHRRHTAGQTAAAVERLRQAGIKNISIDLMFGFPGETIEEWQHDIDAALALQVEHISAYSLTYEEGTPLERLRQANPTKYGPVSEELSLAMYHLLIDRLEAAGFEHYEISNFARPDFRSRHNSNYWQAVPYIGLGAAAHSYDVDTRSWNVSDVRRYVESIESGQRPVENCELLSDSDRFDDMVMTRLRTCEGISIAAVRHDFGPEKERFLLANAQRHIDNHLLAMDDDHLHLTRQGLFVSDGVMSDLMDV